MFSISYHKLHFNAYYDRLTLSMTEFRRDPLIGRWVVTGFSHGRNLQELIPTLNKNAQEVCPFCSGKEHLTPPETYAVRRRDSHPNKPGWEIRVIPNRATDLMMGELHKRAQGGIYDLQNPSGIHETIVESPEHVTRFSALSIEQMVKILDTFQKRHAEHKKNHTLKGTLIFRNQGRGSVSLFEHTHSQIISLPFIPKTLSDELSGAKRFYDMKMRCIFCDMIFEETRIKTRVISENDHYFAWCPFASRFPFEIWVIGREHQSDFLDAGPDTFTDLARILKTVLEKVEKVLGDYPISFVLHTAPLRCDVTEDCSYISSVYHWHIEILPHALPPGGFEWGWDFFLSPPAPETCAQILRDA